MTQTVSTAHGAKRNWLWILIYGLFLISVGLFALMHPAATGLAIGIMLAASFLLGGVGALAAAFMDAGWQSKLLDLLYGVMCLVAGFICFVNPLGGAISLAVIIGIFFLVAGGFEFVIGFKTGDEKVPLIVLGMIDMLIGFWMVFLMGPGDQLIAIATLLGLGFIFRGVVISALAFKVRSLFGR